MEILTSRRAHTVKWTGWSCNEPGDSMDGGTLFLLNIVIQFSVAETDPRTDHADDAHHSQCDCRLSPVQPLNNPEIRSHFKGGNCSEMGQPKNKTLVFQVNSDKAEVNFDGSPSYFCCCGWKKMSAGLGNCAGQNLFDQAKKNQKLSNLPNTDIEEQKPPHIHPKTTLYTRNLTKLE